MITIQIKILINAIPYEKQETKGGQYFSNDFSESSLLDQLSKYLVK